jgi:diguanylate cyclase (GGDEF)-like protein
MESLGARVMGQFSLFVQIAGVALILGIWTAVRQTSRRRRFDAWWIGLLALVLGLASYAVGVFVAGNADGDSVALPFMLAYTSLEYVSGFYFYIGACRVSGIRPHPRARLLLALAIVAYAVLAMLHFPFLQAFAVHSLFIGIAYTAAALALRRALRTLGGPGLRIVAASLVVLALTFLSYTPFLLSSMIVSAPGTSSFDGGIYVALSAYAKMLVEIVIAIGMFVAEIDRVNEALQSANVRLLAAQERLNELASTDALTGLRNRGALERARASGRFDSGYVVCLDLDGLKTINDRYGHPLGDRAICAFAENLREYAEHRDAAFRIGGDEFMLVFIAESEREIVIRMQTLQREISVVLDDGTELALHASFGIARFDDPRAFGKAVALADARLYAHKARSR